MARETPGGAEPPGLDTLDLAEGARLKGGETRRGRGVPLYQQVREGIRAEINRGTWKPGDMMPTELEIARQFEVSPGTAKQALLGLVSEGLIVRQAGKGTFVARIDSSQSFARFFQFREEGTGNKLNPTIRVVEVRILDEAPPEAQKHLDLGADPRVLFVRRLLSQEQTPICIYDSYLPYALVAGLETERLDIERIYHAIERRFGIHVVEVEEMLRAGLVHGGEAKLLDVFEGSPVIEIERIAYSHQGLVLEWRRTTGRSDHFIYRIKQPVREEPSDGDHA